MLRNITQSRHLNDRWIRAVAFAVCFFCGAIFIFGFQTPDALAQVGGAEDQLAAVGVAADIDQGGDIFMIVGRLINVALGTIGVILVILIIYAGYLWMTAAGNPETVQKAKDIIRNAVIGLMIVVSAFAIVRFILDQLTGGGPGGGVVTTPSGPPGGGFFPTQAGALGAVIESHYPKRNALKVPRNTNITITFKFPIAIGSIIAGYNDNGTPDDLTDDTVTEGLNTEAVKIFRTEAGEAGALTSDRIRVLFTPDRKTFVFRQVECPPEPNCFGSPTVDTDYSVLLTGGLNGVLRDDNSPAFTGIHSEGYRWSFQVGTILDLDPPRVVSATPRPGKMYDRNILIQVRFNEAVDPVSASGFAGTLLPPHFTNIQTIAGGVMESVAGEYRISNQYRTVEFIPAEECGVNTCGDSIFCLPGGVQISPLVQSAEIDGPGPQGVPVAGGWSGVVDMAGNALDGNGDGTTEGQGIDDYMWIFTTTNNINLTPPKVEETFPPAEPGLGQSHVDPMGPVTIRWNTILQSSTFNTNNAYLRNVYEPPELDDTFWFTTENDVLTATNELIETPDDEPAKSFSSITHRPFSEETIYQPFLLSGIRSQYQNCFIPAASTACHANSTDPNCCQSETSRIACDERSDFNPTP